MKNEIVFEDLHGVNDAIPVMVDLDADSKEDGIKRVPAEQVVADDAADNDDIQFSELRGAESAPQENAGEDDASKVSVDDGYSKKVKARIQRATRATAKEKTRGDYWENQARELAKGAYSRDKSSAERTIEQADSQIESTLAQLDTAIEGGNTKDQVRLTSELTDQKAAKIQAEISLDNLSPDGNVQPFDDKVTSTQSSDSSKADSWTESRNDWYGAKGFERQTRLANRLDKAVFADGYDPNTEEYFTELDRRLKEKEPSLYDEDIDDDAGKGDTSDKGRGKTRSPVAAVGGVDNTRSSKRSGNRVELGETDFENMRRFHLDPNDPAVLREYARNKLESSAGER